MRLARLPFPRSGNPPYNREPGARSTPKPSPRAARIEARIHPDTLAVVRRAAELQGRSLSDFVVAAAEQAARRAIEETSVIRLSAEGQRDFVDLLLNPPSPNAALERARAHHERLIGPA
ncbi:DUF1778 domain-containing protein [Methylobacterium oryzisoli]|uniref:type II toxin-antitoxin system TacA family antitoxin n=1 Tax=Methylobacterium oryzisoli TaxID=3385502 RepID=UPI003892162D